MAGIILEGGTFRAIFSCGVMDALIDNNIEFPYCIGVSAGISDAASYITKQKGRNLKILEKYRNDKRYLSLTNIFRQRSMFGIDFVFNDIPLELVPFDFDAFAEYKGTFKVGVTNCITGKAEYLDGKDLDRKSTMFRATCAIPMIFPHTEINGVPYYDGGIADPIPIKKAVEDGNEKNLIVLTQPEGYVKTLNRNTKFVAKKVQKKYPELAKKLLNRHEHYNETVKYCLKLEKEGKAIVLRPKYKLNSLEKDPEILRRTNDMGYDIAIKKINDIKKLFN